VTAFCSRIARQLSEIDRYYSGQSTRKSCNREGSGDIIEELTDEDEEQEEWQGKSSAEGEEESEMEEEERNAGLDEEEREHWSAVVRTQSGYLSVDERQKRTDAVTSGDDKQAYNEDEVPEVSMIASNQEKRTVRTVVAFSTQLAKADTIENMTSMTPQDPTMLPKQALAVDNGNYKVLRSSQPECTILARQVRETGELTVRLLARTKTGSVPKEKPVATMTVATMTVATMTVATRKKIEITHNSGFSSLTHHIR